MSDAPQQGPLRLRPRLASDAPAPANPAPGDTPAPSGPEKTEESTPAPVTPDTAYKFRLKPKLSSPSPSASGESFLDLEGSTPKPSDTAATGESTPPPLPESSETPAAPAPSPAPAPTPVTPKPSWGLRRAGAAAASSEPKAEPPPLFIDPPAAPASASEGTPSESSEAPPSLSNAATGAPKSPSPIDLDAPLPETPARPALRPAGVPRPPLPKPPGLAALQRRPGEAGAPIKGIPPKSPLLKNAPGGKAGLPAGKGGSAEGGEKKSVRVGLMLSLLLCVVLLIVGGGLAFYYFSTDNTPPPIIKHEARNVPPAKPATGGAAAAKPATASSPASATAAAASPTPTSPAQPLHSTTTTEAASVEVEDKAAQASDAISSSAADIAAKIKAPVDKTQDFLNNRRNSEQVRVDSVLEGRDVPDRASTAKPAAPRPGEPTTQTINSSYSQEIAPGLSGTISEVTATKRASQQFRQLVGEMVIKGVFQGNPSRAIINGRLVNEGDQVDKAMGVIFLGIEADKKMITFQDKTGATVSRRY